MNLDDAIRRFRMAAIEKGDFAQPASEDNRLHRELAMAWRVLSDHGASGRAAFRRLLDDESMHVRGWVAAHLLSEGDRDAVAVLEAIAKGDGFGRLTAQTTLQEWRANRLSSPFDALSNTPLQPTNGAKIEPE